MTRNLPLTFGALGSLLAGCPGETATSASADPPDSTSGAMTGTTGTSTEVGPTTSGSTGGTSTTGATGTGDGPTTGATGTGDGPTTGATGTGDPTAPGAVCGDGVVDPGEQCDDGPDNADANGCTAACMHNVCGDGKVGPGEGCDDGDQDDRDECSNACAAPTCGDGAVDEGEQCDDGDADDADACTAACTHATCGDGVAQAVVGEQCDAGPGNADTAACTTACQEAVCGDGHVRAGVEQCDAGADNGPGKSCKAGCELNVCGDGDKGPGEACDDGDGDDGDGCDGACQLETCGDGELDPGEACDDGKDGDPDDGCTDACALPACGDGLLQPSLGEQCDDGGFNADTGACTLACAHAVCGDGLVRAQVEQCDIGDNGPGKVCNAACEPNVCGDGDRSPAEACDDGNLVGGDGCSPVCKHESSLACAELVGTAPIVLDDLEQTGGPAMTPPTAMLWRDDLVLARGVWGPQRCDVRWERRDAAGQLLAPPVEIEIPHKDIPDADTCVLIGDLGWDPVRQRYIFVMPQNAAFGVYSTPVAITPAGQLVWVGTGERRQAIVYGVTSQIRVVDDEVLVFGHDRNTLYEDYPAAIHIYGALDGKNAGSVHRGEYASHSAIACDATCSAGVAIYSSFDLHMDNFFFGPQIQLEPGGNHYPGALLWRGGATYFATAAPHALADASFRTYIVTAGVGWTMKDEVQTGTDTFMEPSILEIDDGYLVAVNAFPHDKGKQVPDDPRKLRVVGWNIAYDGTIRGSFAPPEHGHSPRLAYKNGRVALTYVRLQEAEPKIDSRKLMFFECAR